MLTNKQTEWFNHHFPNIKLRIIANDLISIYAYGDNVFDEVGYLKKDNNGNWWVHSDRSSTAVFGIDGEILRYGGDKWHRFREWNNAK